MIDDDDDVGLHDEPGVADHPGLIKEASPLPSNVTPFRRPGATNEHSRVIEAVLFAASEPLDEPSLLARLPDGVLLSPLLDELKAHYASRGVNLVCFGGKWSFRTADDLAFLLHREAVEQKRLSQAALETLAIIAYHQPVTRADIEDVRGVAVSKGTLDVLLESGWIRLRGRRRTPGRPLTYGTSDAFLDHFGLESLDTLPGLDELKAAGLLTSEIPGGFEMPGTGEIEDGDDDGDGEDTGAESEGDAGFFDEPDEFTAALTDDDAGSERR